MMVLLLAAGAVLFPACTERIDIKLDSTYTRLVVYGEITSDSLRHTVTLTSTADYFSNTPAPKISGATVELRAGDELYLLNPDPENPGQYKPDVAFRGKPGTSYHLQISNVDIDGNGETEVYEAETTMPEAVAVDSIRVIPFQTPFFNGHQVLLFAQDPSSRQFYNYKILRNGELLTDTLIEFISQSDELFNGNYLYALPVTFLNDDDPDEAVKTGDFVTLEMSSIPEDYYYFISDARSEIFGSVPIFSGPPANVRSNISGDALGFFVAYSVSRASAFVFF